MFVCNVKVNGNKLGKLFLGILFALIIVITLIVMYRIIGNSFFKTNDSLKPKDVYELTPNNYTNVLKTVNENVNNYVGQKVRFSGYIYRVLDFKENQFVLARDMVISSDFQTVVVGFLCEYETAKQYEDKCWVEVEGTIKKGNYHGKVAILEIEKMDKIEKPSEEYVYPPDDSFVSTSTVL